MPLLRSLEPEWLDALPPHDRHAIRSRLDLRRLNACMGHASFLARILGLHGTPDRMSCLIDLGGGDATLALAMARRLPRPRRGMRIVVVDRVDLVSEATRDRFASLGWDVEVVVADVPEWLERTSRSGRTVVMANLFLHHLGNEDLQTLLSRAASAAQLFVACEPRRSPFVLLTSGMVGLLGCNSITRHDAIASVRAGFRGREISRLWPEDGEWSLEEGTLLPFGHFFVARRADPPRPNAGHRGLDNSIVQEGPPT